MSCRAKQFTTKSLPLSINCLLIDSGGVRWVNLCFVVMTGRLKTERSTEQNGTWPKISPSRVCKAHFWACQVDDPWIISHVLSESYVHVAVNNYEVYFCIKGFQKMVH